MSYFYNFYVVASVVNCYTYLSLGFGGNGQGEDTCVRSGEFRAGAWKPVTEDCLRRNFTDTPVCDDYIQEILKYASFTTFEQALRVDVHNKMHCNISRFLFRLKGSLVLTYTYMQLVQRF